LVAVLQVTSRHPTPLLADSRHPEPSPRRLHQCQLECSFSYKHHRPPYVRLPAATPPSHHTNTAFHRATSVNERSLDKRDPLQFTSSWPPEENSCVNPLASQEGTEHQCHSNSVSDFSFPEFFLKLLLFLLICGAGIGLVIDLPRPMTSMTQPDISHQPWNIWNSYIQPIQKITTDILFNLNQYLWYLWPPSDNGLTFSHSNWPIVQLHIPNQPQLLPTLIRGENPWTILTISAIHIIHHWAINLSSHLLQKITRNTRNNLTAIFNNVIGSPFGNTGHEERVSHWVCSWLGLHRKTEQLGFTVYNLCPK